MNHLKAMMLLLLINATAVAQQPVKVNLLDYFEKVLPPPSSATEAYEKSDWGKGGKANVDKMFKAVEDDLQKFQASISLPSGSPQEDMMKKMQDPEFKKKMKTMSKEEKMKMATEMSQRMSPAAGQMKPESEAVTKTMRDCSKLTEEATRDLGGANAAMKEQLKRIQDLEARHTAVDDWTSAEIAKLPIVGGGEAAGPDPKAVDAVQLKGIKKHIAIVDEDLKRTSKDWLDARTKSKQMYAEYAADLEAIHFGDDANNNTTKAQLSTGQTRMVSSLVGLVGDSKTAYTGAAPWYDRLVQHQMQPRL